MMNDCKEKTKPDAKVKLSDNENKEIWVIKVLIIVIIIYIFLLIKTVQFYYTTWFDFLKNFKDWISFIGILVTFGIITTKTTGTKIIKYFLAFNIKTQKYLIAISMILLVVLGIIINETCPYMKITKINESIDIGKKYNVNLKYLPGGVAYPKAGYIQIVINTKYNKLENYNLSLSLYPQEWIEFSSIKTEKNIGFENLKDIMESGKKETIIKNNKVLKGSTTVLLRLSLPEGKKNIENGKLKAVLSVGGWVDEEEYSIYDN